MKKIKKNIPLIILTALALLFFFSCSTILKKENIYQSGSSDRFYSYDDVYYATKVFNSKSTKKYDLVYSSVKHPLFTFGANKFTQMENIVLPNITESGHFYNLVVIQIAVSLVGIIFLYLILRDIFNLKVYLAILLSIIYIFANCVIISTLTVESFVYSSTLLISSYYFISKKRWIISGILGLLVMGTTLTNIAIWGILVIFLNGKDLNSIIKMIIAFLLTTIVVALGIYIIEGDYLIFIIQNTFGIAMENAERFTVDSSFIMILKRGFYYLFTSGFFYIDTINTNQSGYNVGNAISFVPAANLWITSISVIMYLVLIILIIKKLRKGYDKNIVACLIVLLFNIVLHVVIGFGLIEAFLYTPHFIFSIILLIGLMLKEHEQYEKTIVICLFLLLATELLFNFQSIVDMIKVVKGALI